MITPYRSLSFDNHDVITKDDMDQAQSNLQWLLDNTPRGRFYRESGQNLDVKTVILCGRVGFGKNKKNHSVIKPVRFGNAFAPTCYPNITTGIVSDGQREIFCVVNGPGGKIMPNSSGFDLVINVPRKDKPNQWAVNKPFYVYWQAYGYRRDNANDF